MKSGIICAVALAAITLVSASATAGKPVKPPPTPVPEPVGYYAANGALVGTFNNGSVVMRLDGLVFEVAVNVPYPTDVPSGGAWEAAWIMFDQINCQGNAYIAQNVKPGFSGVAAVSYDFPPVGGISLPSEITLHVARTDTLEYVGIYSYLHYFEVSEGLFRRCAGGTNPDMWWAYPVVGTYDLMQMFPLPLTIR